MTDTAPEIERINALTVNARNTWFVLLGALVFVGITLMGVEHIDFYGVDRATTLPLVNVEVPTRFFFVAAPMLVAAIYGYFHLYLIRLWDALSVAPARIDDRPLGDVISPWLVTDAALHLRARMRGDACTTPRAIEGAAMLLNIALAWVFGLLVLALLWWQSMPARDVLMTGLAGAALAVALFVGASSLAMMVLRMRAKYFDGPAQLFSHAPAMAAVLVVLPCIAIATQVRTVGEKISLLAPISMVGEAAVERPKGWLPYDVARAAFKDQWCHRKTLTCSTMTAQQEREFATDWHAFRGVAREDLRQPHWSGSQTNTPVRWQNASVSGLFAIDANFSRSDLTRARLFDAHLEHADFRKAVLDHARLDSAHIQHADFAHAEMYRLRARGAHMRQANFDGAKANRVDLLFTDLRGATFRSAELRRARFSFADLGGATLRTEVQNGLFFHANLTGADLSNTKLISADLAGANLSNVAFGFTSLTGSSLNYSLIAGSFEKPVNVDVGLSGTSNTGGAVRHADLRAATWDEKTDWRNAFLDGSVIVDNAFRNRMGRPCQWIETVLSDEEFLRLWRWWAGWHVPIAIPVADLPDTPMSAARLEELGLTNCKPGQPFGPMPTD